MEENKFIQTTLHEHGILQVSLNRPEQLNALNHQVLQSLYSIFEQAKSNVAVTAILLMGEGKGFCAGADINELSVLNGQSGLAFAQFGQLVFRCLESLGKPSLAAIHGFALGGGCELAMSTTLRIASSQTVFGQPEIKLGIMPGFGGTQRLPRLIGKTRALEILLTGRKLTAEEALRWGLINELIPADELLTRAKAILYEIIQYGSFALQSIITTVHQGLELPLVHACELEAAQFGLCCSTEEKQEGVNAFLEKRTPVFKGSAKIADRD